MMLQISPPGPTPNVTEHPESMRQRRLKVVMECWGRFAIRRETAGTDGRASLEDAIRGGEALHDVRSSPDFQHGEWGSWLKANVPFSHRKVLDWMNIWAYRDEDYEGLKIRDVANIGAALKAIQRINRERRAKNPPPLPDGKYSVIVADPPWPLDDLPYDPMVIEKIREFPVANMTANDCVLFLWRVCRFDREAHDVMDAWGFVYAGRKLTWVKDRANGTHPWLAGRHEDCIIGRRGNPLIMPGQVDVIEAPRRRHSEKPQAAFDRIEAMCPAGDGQRLELFARRQRPGWTVYGNEA